MTNTVRAENYISSPNIINISSRFSMPVMQSMVAEDTYTEELYERTAEQQDKGSGMDAFPIEIYNKLIKYNLESNKLRNAMYLVLSANYGMRYSDVVRIRFCHIFDKNGTLRESFTLPYGEKKTGKVNIYYNNRATATIISMYLQKNPTKTPYDFLFVSESNKKKYSTLREIEAEELYGVDISNAEKQLKILRESVDKTMDSYISGTFSAEEYKNISEKIKEKIKKEENNLQELVNKCNNYTSSHPEADTTKVVSPISHPAAENIIKESLEAIGIYTKNRKSKSVQSNLDCKLNTHSFRKTFGELFYKTGCELRESGELLIDPTMLSLLQQKFMHCSVSTTNRYNQNSEKAFRKICTAMNVGLDVLNEVFCN